MLDKLTDLHLDLVCSSTANEEQVVIERDLFLTYQERHSELLKLNKSFCEAVNKQQAGGLGRDLENWSSQLTNFSQKRNTIRSQPLLRLLAIS